MNDWMLIGISLIFIFIIIGISTRMDKKSMFDTEFRRKFVHIAVGNWIFLGVFFENLLMALAVPSLFIIVNFASVQFNLIPSMERDGDKRNYGTVFYAVSLTILTAIGFVFNAWFISYIGILIMTYGDGCASLVGKKFGKHFLFPFAKDKTLEGSLAVFAAGFTVTFAVGAGFGFLQHIPPFYLGLIAFSNGVFSVFLELTGKNGFDNLLLPIGSGIFGGLMLLFFSPEHLLIIAASAVILLGAYKKNAVTVDGAVSAMMTAQLLYVFGGTYLYITLILFFLLGSAVSKIKNARKRLIEEKYRTDKIDKTDGKGRNWIQVLCNSLPAVILAIIFYAFGYHDALLLSFAVFSAAASDTFASELGTLSGGRVFSILSGKTVPGGLSGGVTVAGFFAGILGSLLLSAISCFEFGFKGFLIVFGLGIIGCIIDSVLGILLQRKFRAKNGELRDTPEFRGDLPISGFAFVSNNTVNMLSLCIVPCVGIMVIHFFR